MRKFQSAALLFSKVAYAVKVNYNILLGAIRSYTSIVNILLV